MLLEGFGIRARGRESRIRAAHAIFGANLAYAYLVVLLSRSGSMSVEMVTTNIMDVSQHSGDSCGTVVS